MHRRHHTADSYIALLPSFIPCGAWEAVHILDALLKAPAQTPLPRAAKQKTLYLIWR